jgi:hypothetical protein
MTKIVQKLINELVVNSHRMKCVSASLLFDCLLLVLIHISFGVMCFADIANEHLDGATPIANPLDSHFSNP